MCSALSIILWDSLDVSSSVAFFVIPRNLLVWQNKAVEFSKLQICVDLFLFSAQYTDVATLANLSKFSAGQLFYYPVRALSEKFDSVNAYMEGEDRESKHT